MRTFSDIFPQTLLMPSVRADQSFSPTPVPPACRNDRHCMHHALAAPAAALPRTHGSRQATLSFLRPACSSTGIPCQVGLGHYLHTFLPFLHQHAFCTFDHAPFSHPTMPTVNMTAPPHAPTQTTCLPPLPNHTYT